MKFDKTRKQLLTWANWFFLGNCMLFWLLGLRFIHAITPLALSIPTLTNKIRVWVFLILAFISHLSLLAFLPYLLLILPLLLIIAKPRLIIPLAILIASVAGTLFIIDTFVFSGYRYHLNGIVLHLVMGGQMMQIFSFSWLEWLLLSLISCSIVLIESFYGLWLWKKISIPFLQKYDYKIIGVLAVGLLFSYNIFFLAGIEPRLSLNQQSRALPFFDNIAALILPIKNSLNKVENVGGGNYVQPEHGAHTLHYPLHALQCTQPEKPLNIVIIAIDTWRYDTVNPTNMPNVFNFAQSSWQFKQHWSGGNATQSGIFTLFYAIPGSYWSATLQQQKGPVFIEELIKQHYQLNILSSATLTQPAMWRNVFSQISHLQLSTPGDNPFARDQTILNEFIQFINKASKKPQPFFSFLFFDGAHGFCNDGNPVAPFKPSITVCNHLELTKTADATPYINRYKNAVFFVDQLVGLVITTLQQKQLLDNTIVIITGDHGQEFNDNHLGFWEHASNFTHYQAQTPLIIHWPHEKPKIFTHLTSHFDIVPTLLTQAMGCTTPMKDYCTGKSLFDSTSPEYLIISSYIDFGIIEPDRITTIYPTGNFEITDLNAHIIPDAKLRMDVMKKVFGDLKKFQ